MSKYDLKKRVLKDLPDFAEKQAKFEADRTNSIDWKPTFSRVKIRPDAEQLSGVLDAPEGWGESLTRGVIVALGPQVGFRDGVLIEKFWVGQRVLYLSKNVMQYRGADGVMHHFLKENSDLTSIIAVEPAKDDSLESNLEGISAVTKSLNEKANDKG